MPCRAHSPAAVVSPPASRRAVGPRAWSPGTLSPLVRAWLLRLEGSLHRPRQPLTPRVATVGGQRCCARVKAGPHHASSVIRGSRRAARCSALASVAARFVLAEPSCRPRWESQERRLEPSALRFSAAAAACGRHRRPIPSPSAGRVDVVRRHGRKSRADDVWRLARRPRPRERPAVAARDYTCEGSPRV